MPWKSYLVSYKKTLYMYMYMYMHVHVCMYSSLSLPLYSHKTPGLPLVSLDLMDYCHVTDLGIAFLSSMNSLTHLSLSRTKLTDNGMPFIQGHSLINFMKSKFAIDICAGLSGLRELSLDNTLITDQGIKYISGKLRY